VPLYESQNGCKININWYETPVLFLKHDTCSAYFFYHACQSAVAHIFCNYHHINNLLTYLLTYLLVSSINKVLITEV